MLVKRLYNSLKKLERHIVGAKKGSNKKMEDLMAEVDKDLAHFQKINSLIQSISHTGVWEWLIESNAVLWSDELYHVIGLKKTKEAPKFEDYMQLIHPDDQQHFQKTIEESLSNQKSFQLTHRLIKPNGEQIILSCRGQAVFSDGKPEYMFGTAQDVTAETQARELLKKSEQHYKLLTENSRELICLHEPDGTYKYVSPSAERVTGYTSEELLGKNPYNFFHPEDQEHIRNQSHDKVIEGQVASSLYRFRKKSGEYIWLHTLSQPIFNEQKELSEIHTSSRDYTEQETAKAKIKNQEKKFKGLLESAPDAMIIVNKTGKIVIVNAQAEQLFGYRKDEMLGNTVEMLIPKRYSKHRKHREGYSKQPNTRGMGGGRELFGLRKDGTEFPVEISLSPIETDEGLLVSSAIRDISDRVAIQNELKKAKNRAEETAQLKQDFLANMSHEIRTPMNAIMGFTKFLLNTNLDKEQEDYAYTIDQSIEDLLLIINDILDFSRLESGKLELELTPFDLRSKMKQVAKLNQLKAEEKGLVFHFSWDEQLQPFVYGDPLRIGQTITNLLSNAIKFTAKGSVSLAIKQLAEDQDNVHIQFQVSDTGIGIPEESQHVIFDSFRQAQGNTTREYGGTGLGLSIVKNLIELHHGNIQFDSKLGHGSTFTVDIWYKKAVKHDIPQPTPTNKKTKVSGLKILLAEDNRANQLICKKICKDWGVAIDIVGNGKEAVAKISPDYDLILMDIQMPVMDGEEATRKIKLMNNEVAQIPIIALTAHAMKEEQERFIKLGMAACLFKPFKENELIEVFKRYSKNKEA